jgi:hypothetical protein
MAQAPYRVQVSGLKEVAKALRQAPARLDKRLKKANQTAITRAVVPAVKKGAPRKSGRLARSVRGLATAKRAQLAVGSNVRVPYAGVINFGWPAHNIQPQEFIYRGIEQSRDEILDIYVDELDQVAKEIAPQGKL